MTTRRTIGIVGAGLAGSLAALALAGRGHRVVLVDREPRILTRASRNNEGKVHLGFTYGLDPSGRTREVMYTYGSAFESGLAGLLGGPVGDLFISRRTTYAVIEGSMLSGDAARAHVAALDSIDRQRRGTNGDARSEPFVRELSALELGASYGSGVTLGFDVAEATLECSRLCERVEAAVTSAPGVEVITGFACTRIAGDRRAVIEGADGPRLGPFDAVVNCAWDGLPALAAASGHPIDGLNLRAKTGFIARVEAGMPAGPTTFCWGSYGDVVPQRDGSVYVSWYPACRMGITNDLDAGCAWFDGLAQGFDFAAAYAETRHAMQALIPELALAPAPESAPAGAILAAARTDIDDPRSGLHQRTRIGVKAYGSTLVANTGKLTCAPGLAREIADILS